MILGRTCDSPGSGCRSGWSLTEPLATRVNVFCLTTVPLCQPVVMTLKCECECKLFINCIFHFDIMPVNEKFRENHDLKIQLYIHLHLI